MVLCPSWYTNTHNSATTMPSKTIIAVIIICAASITAVLLVQRNTSQVSATQKVAGDVVATNVKPIQPSSTDSDNDGIPDWQEVLIGTNPNKADTDGDGTYDGDEVKSKRNPLKAGPNDKITVTNTIAAGADTSKTVATADGEGTITDKIAKDFMSQYLLAKQGGAQVTSEDALQITQNILSEPQYLQATGVVYTATDIHISTGSDKATVLAYYDAFTNSLKNRASGHTQPELDILTAAVQKNDPNELKKLDPVIADEKSFIRDMLTMTVPADAVQLHLNFLNAASNVLANTEGIRETFTDPVRSFTSLSQFKTHVIDVRTALSNLNAYFQSKK